MLMSEFPEMTEFFREWLGRGGLGGGRLMTRMRGTEQRPEVKRAGGEAAGRTEKPLCGLEPGPEGPPPQAG